MITVSKRVSLEFLGDDYKEGYIKVRSIPLKEYDSLQSEIKKIESDNTKALGFIKTFIISRFVEGKIPQDGSPIDITPENIDELPGEVFIEVMSQLSGQSSPKV